MMKGNLKKCEINGLNNGRLKIQPPFGGFLFVLTMWGLDVSEVIIVKKQKNIHIVIPCKRLICQL
jgi:hypothetical protein